jgi:GNAT superfamily N-acetyltransferase
MLHARERVRHLTSLYLKELYVSAGGRRTGTGASLMNTLFEIATREGCSRVEWTTDRDNKDAQEFYAALGAMPLASKLFYRVTGNDLAQRGPHG